jgi:Spy/CpxP family protein refolding chaperone
MKKITFIAALALVAFAGTTTYAQQAKPQQLQAVSSDNDEDDDQIERFKDKLNLTPEQKTQIKAIRDKRAAEKNDLKAKLKALRDAEREEIKAILTEEQRALIKEKKEMKHEQIKGSRPAPKHKKGN